MQTRVCDVDACVHDSVRRHRHRVSQFPQLDHGELFQDCRIRVMLAMPRYDPRYSLLTFVNDIVSKRLIDLHREHERRRGRETIAAARRKYAGAGADGERRVPVVYPDEVLEPEEPAPETVEGELLGSSETETLAEWCSMIRRDARIRYGRRTRRLGGAVLPDGPSAPLVLLMARLGPCVSAVVWVLEQRPALGYRRVPTRRRLEAAASLLVRLREQGDGEQSPAEQGDPDWL
jgi:DNA-directed RNA polymerase specialized sigma24 family protein